MHAKQQRYAASVTCTDAEVQDSVVMVMVEATFCCYGLQIVFLTLEKLNNAYCIVMLTVFFIICLSGLILTLC